MATVFPLPLYPSHASLSTLSPSQQSVLTQHISTSLQHTLALPPPKRDTPATRAFVDSYVREGARETLEAIIWDSPQNKTKTRKTVDTVIRNRVLLLAEKLASASPGLEIETLVDTCVVYSSTHPVRLRAVLSSAVKTSPALLVPSLPDAFVSLLQPSSPSLYALRKTSYCLLALLRAAPPELTALFAADKPFMLALAKAYDAGLAGIARSYGGLRSHEHEGEGDEWERVWVETKVSLMDTFHVLLSSMLVDLARHGEGAAGLGRAVERVFDIVFALLDLPSSSATPNDSATPFMNRPLLADYQHAYKLTHTLGQTLSRQAEQDARLELLEASLSQLSPSSSTGPGALKILLRSSGAPSGIDTRGPKQPKHHPDTKGKGKAPERAQEDPELGTNTAQILSILPDTDPRTVRALLRRAGANVESVLGLLLEGGGAPDDLVLSDNDNENENEPAAAEGVGPAGEEYIYTKSRLNVFDDEVIDPSTVHMGKNLKGHDEKTVMRDRTFIEEMKADILRRAELISDSEEDDDEQVAGEKAKGRTAAYEDGLDEVGRVHGDGEDSAGERGSDGEEGEDEDGGREEEKQTPETILELAYIHSVAVFERDAATRRSKERVALREATRKLSHSFVAYYGVDGSIFRRYVG